MNDKNCRQLLADGFGIDAYQMVDMNFYMDLAAVASRIDSDSDDMLPEQRELIREAWSDMLDLLDVSYTRLQKAKSSP